MIRSDPKEETRSVLTSVVYQALAIPPTAISQNRQSAREAKVAQGLCSVSVMSWILEKATADAGAEVVLEMMVMTVAAEWVVGSNLWLVV